jgi:hypothetical protein
VNGAPGASGTSGTSGTSVAVSGTTNTMAKFTSATTIGNSALTDDGSTLTYTGQTVLNRQNSINVTTPGLTATYGLHFGGQTTADFATGITFSSGNATPTTANAGIYVQGSGAYGSRMYLATTDSYATGSRTAITINESGVVTINRNFLQSNTDLRAPIFYDSNDAGYYADFNSTSSTAIRLRGGMLVGPNTTWGAYLQVGGNGHASASYANVVTTDGNLHLDPASTKAMYLNYYVNGIIYLNGTTYSISSNGSYYNGRSANSDALGGYAPSTYVGQFGNSYYQVNTWLQFNGTYGLYWPSVYGAHFSPNDLSTHTQFALRGSKNSYGGIYDSYSSVTGIMYDSAGNGGVYREANGRWYFYYYVANDCMGIGTSSTSSTYSLYLNKGVFAQSRIDATIFYDTNDTTYYLDPNSTGLSLSSNGIVSSGGGTAGGFQNRIYVSGRNRIWSFGNADAYGISYFQGPDYIGLHFGTATQAASQFWVSDTGISQTSASSRAPIFYDSNNTGYYVDPASTTNLNTTLAYSYQGNGNVGGTGNASWHPSGIYCGSTMWQYGDMYKNNTAIRDVQEIYNYGWYRNYGRVGVYSQSYGLHFYPSDSNYWSITGSGGSTFGLQFRSNYDSTVAGYVYGDTGGSFGLLFGGGWAVRTFSGGGELYGTWTTNGDHRAPIFYDSNNTAYYLNPNGGSYFAGSLELANGYFLSNGIGGAMYMTTVSGSFGGYLRTSGHMVLDQMNAGYNVYVLDGNSVGVVKNAGTQSWSAFSDKTIKNIHSVMENNLSKLDGINPIYYSFNNFDDDRNRIGLIAQEVQEHFPELVDLEPRTEKLTLDYTGLIPVLLGAIKELKTEVETLKTKI